MSNHDDKDFNDYLSGNSELSKMYQDTTITNNESDKNNPGLEIDNSILAAAKRGVNSRPQKSSVKNSPFSANYLIPLSTAASFLVVAAMVSFFPEDQIISFTPESVKRDTVVEEKVTLVESKVRRKIVNLKQNELIEIQGFDDQSSQIQKSVSEKRSKAKKENSLNKSFTQYQRNLKQGIITPATDKLATNTGQLELDSIEQEIPVSGDSSTEVQDLVVESITVNTPLLKDDLIYNEKKWKNLSSTEWYLRLKEINRIHGESKAKEIIVHFNKKFPKIKLTIKDIIN